LIGCLFSSVTSFLKIYPNHIAVHNFLGTQTKIISPTDITAWQEISTGKYTTSLIIWTHKRRIDPRIYNTKEQNLLKQLLEEWQPQPPEETYQQNLKQAKLDENNETEYSGWSYVFVVGCICAIGGIYGMYVHQRGAQKIQMTCLPVTLAGKPYLTKGKSRSVIFRPAQYPDMDFIMDCSWKAPKASGALDLSILDTLSLFVPTNEYRKLILKDMPFTFAEKMVMEKHRLTVDSFVHQPGLPPARPYIKTVSINGFGGYAFVALGTLFCMPFVYHSYKRKRKIL